MKLTGSKNIKTSDKLPRRLRLSEHHRCQALTINGHRCRHEARWEQCIHGDPEIHPGSWFVVKACDCHVNDPNIKLSGIIKEQLCQKEKS